MRLDGKYPDLVEVTASILKQAGILRASDDIFIDSLCLLGREQLRLQFLSIQGQRELVEVTVFRDRKDETPLDGGRIRVVEFLVHRGGGNLVLDACIHLEAHELQGCETMRRAYGRPFWRNGAWGPGQPLRFVRDDQPRSEDIRNRCEQHQHA